jgi:hypothetical protein
LSSQRKQDYTVSITGARYSNTILIVGLRVPSSINFNAQELIEIFAQLQQGTISVNRAIEDMRDIVYSNPAALVSSHCYQQRCRQLTKKQAYPEP